MLPSLEASKPRSLEVPRRESRSEINYSSVCPYIDNQDDEENKCSGKEQELTEDAVKIEDDDEDMEKNEDDRSPWEKRFNEPFDGFAIPFGCGVYFKPTSTMF